MGNLRPETAEKFVALERPSVRGDWTMSRAPAGAPPWLVVVQRRESVLAEQLRAFARPDVPVIWDRRDRDRRAIAGPVLLDRRRRDRRGPPPATWGTLRFLVVRPTDPTL